MGLWGERGRAGVGEKSTCVWTTLLTVTTWSKWVQPKSNHRATSGETLFCNHYCFKFYAAQVPDSEIDSTRDIDQPPSPPLPYTGKGKGPKRKRVSTLSIPVSYVKIAIQVIVLSSSDEEAGVQTKKRKVSAIKRSGSVPQFCSAGSFPHHTPPCWQGKDGDIATSGTSSFSKALQYTFLSSMLSSSPARTPGGITFALLVHAIAL